MKACRFARHLPVSAFCGLISPARSHFTIVSGTKAVGIVQDLRPFQDINSRDNNQKAGSLSRSAHPPADSEHFYLQHNLTGPVPTSDMAYYPVIANTDYSPIDTSMAYNEPRDSFCGSFAYNEPEFGMIDPQFTPHLGFNNMPPAVDGWTTPSNTPFGGIGNLCTAFTTTELSEMRTSRHQSQSKSHRDNTESMPARSRHSSRFEARSPSSHGQASPYSEDMQHLSEEEDNRPRKRGRPRLTREPSESVYTSSEPPNTRRTTCLPHKQVERKYREGSTLR